MNRQTDRPREKQAEWFVWTCLFAATAYLIICGVIYARFKGWV